MSFLKAFSKAKPGNTTNTVAEALDPTVVAVHPKNDRPTEPLKSDGTASSEHSVDEKNPFSDPKVAEYYKGLYEESQYECRDADGQWWRCYGNENWEFAENGLMSRREASINDLRIDESDRRLHGPRAEGDSTEIGI